MVLLACLLLFGFSNDKLCAHGIEASPVIGGSGYKIKYADGEPMAFAEVKVYSPEDEKTVFQEGFSDNNGVFIFVPDTDGQWRIEFNDGMGHGAVKKIDIKGLKSGLSKNASHIPLYIKLIGGFGIISLVTGFLFYFKASKLGSIKNAHT
ncbi:MAG: hypothetical protein U9Q34_01515 [Elusimicrobiota bacterium]|nr:hypothetical protein [Elusimicrobiota bacterium]